MIETTRSNTFHNKLLDSVNNVSNRGKGKHIFK